MTEKLQDTLDYLYDARVPPHWLAVSWLSSAVPTWFGEGLKRRDQLTSWAQYDPAIYWFPGFYNPQGFLTSVRQEISRKKEWALDRVEQRSEVLAEMRNSDNER